MPFIAIHWSFSLYFVWQTYFWKQGFVKQSQYYSLFTQVEHTNVSSPLLFLQQLECLSFLLLTPLSGLFDSYSSTIPLQKMFSLSCMALSLFSVPTRLCTSPYKFTFWPCLLYHLPYTCSYLVPSPRTYSSLLVLAFKTHCFYDSQKIWKILH